jgi:hypothetical protein
MSLLTTTANSNPFRAQGSRARFARAVAVVALACIAMCGNLTEPKAHAAGSHVTSLIVQYEIGAPPMRMNGEPWGAQCVPARADRVLLTRGRWIGAGMRLLQLGRALPIQRAERIARQIAKCPYVNWAEPNQASWTPPLSP